MRSIEEIQNTIDAIGESLKRISSNDSSGSNSLQELESRVISFFPRIEIETLDEDEKSDNSIVPLWWDDLDEEFELEPNYWISTIQKIDLLSPEQVPLLMEDIEAGVIAEGMLNQEITEGSVNVNDSDLRVIVERGKKAFDLMVTHNLKLVLHLSRRYGRRIELEDAFSYGVFGLMQAIRKFDWRLGNQLSTYATWWVRQSLSRNIADYGTTINVPVHALDRLIIYEREKREFEEKEFTFATDVIIYDSNGALIATKPAEIPLQFIPEMDETLKCAIEATAPSEDFWELYFWNPESLSSFEIPKYVNPSSEFKIIADDLTTRLTRHVLSQKELDVILYRHGYIGGEPLTLDDIGKKFGVTRERIRQIEVKAMEKISKFVTGIKLDNYWDVVDIRTSEFLAELSLKAQESRPKKKKSLQPYKQKNKPSGEKGIKAQSERNREALAHSNLERVKKASKSQIEILKWALEILENEEIPRVWVVIAETRIANPELSYLQLAKRIDDGLTKDAVAGIVRRMISRARKVSQRSKP